MEPIDRQHIRLKRNLCLAFCGIIWFIYLPICLYGIISYRKYRSNIIIKKRHSSLNLHLLIFMLILLIIFLPLILITYSFSSKLLRIHEDLHWSRYGVYTFYPVIICLLQVFYVFIWRLWLYYYDVLFISTTANKQWTELLYPLKYTNEQTKSIKHFESNRTFFRVMAALFFATLISIAIWTAFFSYNHIILRIGSGSTAVFWCLACAISLIVLYCKTPRFDDLLFIRKEIMYWIYIIVAVAITLLSDLVIDYIVFQQNNSKLHVIIILANYFLIATAIFIMICVSSIWVLQKNRVSLKEGVSFLAESQIQNNIRMMSLSTERSNKTPKVDEHEAATNMHPVDRDVEALDEQTTVIDALRNEASFDAFVHHLQREFSIEIILSLIEFIEYQRAVYEYALEINEFEQDDNSMPMQADWRSNYDFFVYPSSVPHSSIVHDELENDELALCEHLALAAVTAPDVDGDGSHDDNDSLIIDMHRKSTYTQSKISQKVRMKKIEFLIRAHKLYGKYIKHGAKLEIDISRKERKRLSDLMDSYSKWVNTKDSNDSSLLKMLYKLFETVIDEQLNLLSYSFSRYKNTHKN